MTSLINNTSTTSKRSLWPDKTSNLWVTAARQSVLRLTNGKEYDDWASALGANTLGYDYFERAFRPAASLPWQLEHDFAAAFCRAMGTQAVRFFKSGSDALSCAVRLARAATGRPNIVIFDQSYHGTANEFGPIAWHKDGYVPTPALVMPFGEHLDLAAPLSIAAIVVEPVPKALVVPSVGWLQHLREVCDAYGIMLISDEVILGYRHGLQGFMQSIGLQADLYCYGKAMAQGAALSACTGHADVMKLLTDSVHFSGTNNGEPLPLDIASSTLAAYHALDIPGQLSDLGQYFRDRFHEEGFATRGLNERFEVTLTAPARDATEYCFDRGILFPGWISVAVSQTREQINRLVEVLCRWREEQH